MAIFDRMQHRNWVISGGVRNTFYAFLRPFYAFLDVTHMQQMGCFWGFSKIVFPGQAPILQEFGGFRHTSENRFPRSDPNFLNFPEMWRNCGEIVEIR